MIKKRSRLNIIFWIILLIFAEYSVTASDTEKLQGKSKLEYYAGKVIGYSSSMLKQGDWEEVSVIVHNRGKEALLQVKPVKLPPKWKVKPKQVEKRIQYNQKEKFIFHVKVTNPLKTDTVMWALNAIYKDKDWQRLDTDSQFINSSKIKVKPSSFHFEARREKVSHDFILKNEGRSDLVIRNVTTSCGCTTAFMKSKEGKPISPVFGGEVNRDKRRKWKKKRLKPGESVILTVTYDPMYHDRSSLHSKRRKLEGIQAWHHLSGDNKIKRMVYIKSNDPNTPELQIPLTIEEKR